MRHRTPRSLAKICIWWKNWRMGSQHRSARIWLRRPWKNGSKKHHEIEPFFPDGPRKASTLFKCQWPMPVGEFLYVKWRVRATGQVYEERVSLRNRLPVDMKDHGLTFVIEGPQLYVYLITPKLKNTPYGTPPLNKSWYSKSYVTYEIFPKLERP